MKVFVKNGKVCKVDNEDAHFIDEYTWCLNKGKLNYTWYLMYGLRVGNKVKKVYLHRLIAGARSGDRVSFVSTDTLDCRRQNLRLNGRDI